MDPFWRPSWLKNPLKIVSKTFTFFNVFSKAFWKWFCKQILEKSQKKSWKFLLEKWCKHEKPKPWFFHSRLDENEKIKVTLSSKFIKNLRKIYSKIVYCCNTFFTSIVLRFSMDLGAILGAKILSKSKKNRFKNINNFQHRF